VLVFQPQTAAAAKSSDVTGTAAKRSKLLEYSSNGEGEKRAKHVVPPRTTLQKPTGPVALYSMHFLAQQRVLLLCRCCQRDSCSLYYMLMASSLDLDSFTPPNPWGLS
jgi:hypothetical protein